MTNVRAGDQELSPNVGALIIRIGFLGVPQYTYGIMYPPNPILILRPLYAWSVHLVLIRGSRSFTKNDVVEQFSVCSVF